jgi:hypothetical protein
LYVKISGGVPPYKYSLDNTTFTNVNSDNTIFINNLPKGTYTFFVIDTKYQPTQPTCLSATSFDVAPGRFIKLESTPAAVSCVGGNDGAISLEVSLDNRDEPFDLSRLDFYWTYDNVSISAIFSTQKDITGLLVGRYTVHATYDVDSLICVNQGSTTVQQPTNGAFLVSDIITYDASCGGLSNDGTASVSTTGGWPNIPSYYRLDSAGSWLPFARTFVLRNLSPGDHYVEIAQSSFECIDGKYFTIESDSITLEAEVVKPTCPLRADCAVILTSLSPGTEFAKAGDVFQPLGLFTGLAKGKYYFVARDVNLSVCQSDTLEVIVDDPADCGTGPLSVIVGAKLPATCITAQDGAVHLLPSGGVAPYKFYWDNSVTQGPDQRSDLTPGNHTVKVTDAINDFVTIPVTIDTLDAITFQVSSTFTSCTSSCDATASQLIDGGSNSYTVAWGGGITGEERQNICTGTYDFTISDNRNTNCYVTGSVLIESYPELNISLQEAQAPICPGGTDGFVAVNVTGGTNDYNITWGNGVTGKKLTGVAPGNYTLTVTDNVLGCIKTETLTLPDAAAISVLSSTITPPRCFGGSDGKIVLSLGNVSSPLVEWDNGQIGLTASGLKAGIYTYKITGASGCIITGSEQVIERTALSVTSSSVDATCFGICNGSAQLTVTGGVAPYSIRWSHGPRTASLVNLCAGNYTYTVTDNLSCQVSGSVNVTTPQPLTVFKKSDITPRCYGDKNGSITIEALGGIGAYGYSWSSGQTSSAITGLASGDYAVTVTDENSCTVTRKFSLLSPSPLVFTQDKIKDPSCPQTANGKITPNPMGGTAPFTFLWNDQTTTMVKENLLAGQYTLIVSDANGCAAEKTYALKAPQALEIVNAVVKDPQCANDKNGSVSIEAVGGASPYSFLWSNGVTSSILNNVGGGVYSIIATDKNGCTAVSSYSLINPVEPQINGIPKNITICIGSPTTIEPDGEWTKYQWKGPQNFSATTRRIETSLAGTYTLTAYDLKACPGKTSFTIDASKDALVADFLRLTEAVVFEPVVFVDISTPKPANVQWITPADNDVVVNKQTSENIEIVFTRTGTFEIGMIATMGTCQSELYKVVVVGESTKTDNSGGRSITEERVMEIVTYPNPATEHVSLEIAVPSRDPVEIWFISSIENRVFFQEIREGYFDYLVQWDVSKLTSGVYYLVYKQNKTTKSQRIAVIR